MPAWLLAQTKVRLEIYHCLTSFQADTKKGGINRPFFIEYLTNLPLKRLCAQLLYQCIESIDRPPLRYAYLS